MSKTDTTKPCTAIGPHHGDTCNGGRVQAPNAQFTVQCLACRGTGVATDTTKPCDDVRAEAATEAKNLVSATTWAERQTTITHGDKSGLIGALHCQTLLAHIRTLETENTELRKWSLDEEIAVRDSHIAALEVQLSEAHEQLQWHIQNRGDTATTAAECVRLHDPAMVTEDALLAMGWHEGADYCLLPPSPGLDLIWYRGVVRYQGRDLVGITLGQLRCLIRGLEGAGMTTTVIRNRSNEMRR